MLTLENIKRFKLNSEALFKTLAKQGYTWRSLLQAHVFNSELTEEQRVEGEAVMKALIGHRDRLDFKTYQAAINALFPKNHFRIKDMQNDEPKNNAWGFKLTYFWFDVYAGKKPQPSTTNSETPCVRIKVVAPGSRELTSDIDVTIGVHCLDTTPLSMITWPGEPGVALTEGSASSLIQWAVITYFNKLTFDTLGVTSGTSRDTNVYADGFFKERLENNKLVYDAESSYPKFNKLPIVSGANKDFSDTFSPNNNPIQVYRANKKNKQTLELAASLVPLREYFDLEGHDWKVNLINKLVDEATDLSKEATQKYKNSIRSACGKADEFYQYKKTQLAEAMVSNKDKEFLSESDKSIDCMNELYAEHLLKLAGINQKIHQKQAQIKMIQNNLKQIQEEIDELSDVLSDRDPDAIARSKRLSQHKKELTAYREQSLTLHRELELALKSLAKLYNEQQASQIRANLFAHEAYINHASVYHVVAWMRSQKDDLRIDYKQVVMGSILQQIGFRLLHSTQFEKAQMEPGEVLYRVSKYGHRVGDMVYGELNTPLDNQHAIEQKFDLKETPVLRRLSSKTHTLKDSWHRILDQDIEFLLSVKKNPNVAIQDKGTHAIACYQKWVYSIYCSKEYKKPLDTKMDSKTKQIIAQSKITKEDIQSWLKTDKEAWLDLARYIIVKTYQTRFADKKYFWGDAVMSAESSKSLPSTASHEAEATPVSTLPQPSILSDPGEKSQYQSQRRGNYPFPKSLSSSTAPRSRRASLQKKPGSIKPLAIGQSNFRFIIEKASCYVDKTLFIQELLNDHAQVKLILRPRRSGKTLNMSTAHHFFASEVNGKPTGDLFRGLNIESASTEKGVPCMDFQGKYPVIFLTFKDVKGKTFKEAYEEIKVLISKIYKNFRFIRDKLDLTKKEKKDYDAILNQEATSTILMHSLYNLSVHLHNYYKGKNAIILIDEYDTPILEGYMSGYYDEIVAFMREFFGRALKDNHYLESGILTGILRVSQESLFSGLNNTTVYSCLDYRYSGYFGFTEEEIVPLLQQYIGHAEWLGELKDWYGGYCAGKTLLFNPWSISKFLHASKVSGNKQLKRYWTNPTEKTQFKDFLILDDNLKRHEDLKAGCSDKRQTLALFKALASNQSITVAINESTVFSEIKSNPSFQWSFLLLSGYLALERPLNAQDNEGGVSENQSNKSNANQYRLIIPNREVYDYFAYYFKDLFPEIKHFTFLSRSISSLVSVINELCVAVQALNKKPDPSYSLHQDSHLIERLKALPSYSNLQLDQLDSAQLLKLAKIKKCWAEYQGYYLENFDHALLLYKEESTLYKRIKKLWLDPITSLAQLINISNQGVMYLKMCDYPQALTCHQRVLELKLIRLDDDHYETAMSYNNLGRVLYCMVKYEPALKAFINARDKLLLSDKDKTFYGLLGAVHGNLGKVYFATGQYVKAKTHQEKALAYRKQQGPRQPLGRAISYSHLSTAYHALDDLDRAKKTCRKALQCYRDYYSSDMHSRIAATQTRLARIHLAEGQYAACIQQGHTALKYYEHWSKQASTHASSPAEHPEAMYTYFLLAEAHDLLAAPDQARVCLQKGFDIGHQKSGVSFRAIMRHAPLASWKALERYPNTSTHYEAIYKQVEDSIGDHPETGRWAAITALAWERAGDRQSAHSELGQVKSFAETVRGPVSTAEQAYVNALVYYHKAERHSRNFSYQSFAYDRGLVTLFDNLEYLQSWQQRCRRKLPENSASPKGVLTTSSHALIPSPSEAFIAPENGSRGKLLDEISHYFIKPKQKTAFVLKLVMLWGVSGAGKSELALAYVERYKQQRQPNKAPVYWFYGCMDFFQQCVQLGQLLGLKAFKQEYALLQHKRDALMYTLRTALQAKPHWLLVFDDIDNFDTILTLFPEGFLFQSGHHVLLTTQEQTLTTAKQVPRHIDLQAYRVDIFDDNEAKTYIRRHLPDESTDDIIAMMTRLGRLPLCLLQATAYIKHNQSNIKAYLKQLDKTPEPLLIDSPAEFKPYLLTIHTLLTLSLQKTQHVRNVKLLGFMIVCAYLDYYQFPRELLDKLFGKLTVGYLLTSLRQQAFIRMIDTHHFYMYRLVQRATRSWLQYHYSEQCTVVLDQVVQAFAHLLESHLQAEHYRPLNPRLLQHAKTVVTHAMELAMSEDVVRLFNAVQRYQLFVSQTYKPVAMETELFIAEASSKLIDSPLVLEALYTTLGLAYLFSGDNAKAAIAIAKVKDTSLNLQGQPDPWEALLLGYWYDCIGDFQEAKQILQPLIDRPVASKGLIQAKINHLWGNVLWHQQRFVEALARYDETIKQWRSYYGTDMHMNFATTLCAKGKVLLRQQCFKEAESCFATARNMYRQLLGKDSIHFRVARLEHAQGECFQNQGDYQRAKACYQQALAIKEKIFLPTHETIAFSHLMLGRLFFEEGKPDSAKASLVKAMNVYRQGLYRKDNYLSCVALLVLTLAEQSNSSDKMDFKMYLVLMKELMQTSAFEREQYVSHSVLLSRLLTPHTVWPATLPRNTAECWRQVTSVFEVLFGGARGSLALAYCYYRLMQSLSQGGPQQHQEAAVCQASSRQWLKKHSECIRGSANSTVTSKASQKLKTNLALLKNVKFNSKRLKNITKKCDAYKLQLQEKFDALPMSLAQSLSAHAINNIHSNCINFPMRSTLAAFYRQLSLEQLSSLLAQYRRIILWGNRGIAKPALAWHYAKRYADRYQQLVWLDAKNKAVFTRDCKRVCELLNEESASLDIHSMETVLQALKSTPCVSKSNSSSNRVLIVIKDLEEPNFIQPYLELFPATCDVLAIFSCEYKSNKTFPPYAFSKHALFDSLQALNFYPIQATELSPMEVKQALQQYGNNHDCTWLDSQRHQADALPWVISRAILYLEQRKKTNDTQPLQHYFRQLKSREPDYAERLLYPYFELNLHCSRSNHGYFNVLNVLRMSFNQIRRTQPNSLTLLLMTACFLNKSLLEYDLLQGLQRFYRRGQVNSDVQACIDLFIRYGFLEHGSVNKLYQSHPLMTWVALLYVNEDLLNCFEATVVYFKQHFTYGRLNPKTLGSSYHCMPHITCLLKRVQQWELIKAAENTFKLKRFSSLATNVVELFIRVGSYYAYNLREAASAIPLLEYAEQLLNKYPNHIKQSAGLHTKLLGTLAFAYYLANNVDATEQSVRACHNALALYEKHPKFTSVEILDKARVLCVLGHVYERQANYGLMRDYYQRALRLERRISGDKPKLDIAITLHSLGNFERDVGNLAAAEKYYRDSLNLKRDGYSDDLHAYIALTHQALGEIYSAWGKYGNLAMLTYPLNFKVEQYPNFNNSIQCFQYALYLQSRIYHTCAHQEVAVTLRKLGDVSYLLAVSQENEVSRQALLDQAETYYQEVIAILKHTTHPEWAYAIRGLGHVWFGCAVYDKALEYYQSAYNKLILLYGHQIHPAIPNTLRCIGATLLALGDLQGAKWQLEHVLRIQRQQTYATVSAADRENLAVAHTLSALADVYLKQEKFTAAKHHARQALTIYQRQLGHTHNSHPAVTQCQSHLNKATTWLLAYPRPRRNTRKNDAVTVESIRGYVGRVYRREDFLEQPHKYILRPKVAQQLDTRLTKVGRALIAAPSGSGKTTVVLEWLLKQPQARYPGGVFWFDLRLQCTPQDARQALVRQAGTLFSLQMPTFAELDPAQLHTFFKMVKEPILVIVQCIKFAAEWEEFFPKTPHGIIILCEQVQGDLDTLLIELPVMSEQTCKHYIIQQVGPWVFEPPLLNALKPIMPLISTLPLALYHFIGYLKSLVIQPKLAEDAMSEFANRLTKDFARVATVHDVLRRCLDVRLMEARNTTQSPELRRFRGSITRHTKAKSADVQLVVQRLSLLAISPENLLPQFLVQHGFNAIQRRVFENYQSAGLWDQTNLPHCFVIHPVIQKELVAHLIKEAEQFSISFKHAVALLDEILTQKLGGEVLHFRLTFSSQEIWLLYKELCALRYIKSLKSLATLEMMKRKWGRLCLRGAYFAFLFGHWDMAKSLIHDAIDELSSIEALHPDLVYCALVQGFIHRATHDATIALKAYQRAYQLLICLHFPTVADAHGTLQRNVSHNLSLVKRAAHVPYKQGLLTSLDALKHFLEQAFESAIPKEFGYNPVEMMAIVLSHWGYHYLKLKQLALASPLIQTTFDLKHTLYAKNESDDKYQHPEMGMAYYQSGYACYLKGAYAAALNYFERAQSIFQANMFGGASAYYWIAVYGQGLALCHVERYEEAALCFAELEKYLLPKNDTMLDDKFDSPIGKREFAIKLESPKQQIPPYSGLLYDNGVNLAEVYFQQTRVTFHLEQFTDAAAWLSQLENLPHQANSLLKIRMHLLRGRLAVAQCAFSVAEQHSIHVFELLGAESEVVATEVATKTSHEAIAPYRLKFGLSSYRRCWHPLATQALHDWGELARLRGQWRQAQACFEEVLELTRLRHHLQMASAPNDTLTFFVQHKLIDVVPTLSALADVMQAQGEYDAANKHYKVARDVLKARQTETYSPRYRRARYGMVRNALHMAHPTASSELLAFEKSDLIQRVRACALEPHRMLTTLDVEGVLVLCRYYQLQGQTLSALSMTELLYALLAERNRTSSTNVNRLQFVRAIVQYADIQLHLGFYHNAMHVLQRAHLLSYTLNEVMPPYLEQRIHVLLGEIYSEQHQWDLANECFEKAWPVANRLYESQRTHPEWVRIQCASIRVDIRDEKRRVCGIRHLEQLIQSQQARQRVYQQRYSVGHHPQQIKTQLLLAEAYLCAGKLSKAYTLHKKTLAEYHALRRAHRIDAISTMLCHVENMFLRHAKRYYRLQAMDKGHTLFQAAQNLMPKQLDTLKATPWFARYYYQVAKIYLILGDVYHAERTLKRALQIQLSATGNKPHIYTAKYYYSLATMVAQQRRYLKASQWAHAAWLLYRTALGPVALKTQQTEAQLREYYDAHYCEPQAIRVNIEYNELPQSYHIALPPFPSGTSNTFLSDNAYQHHLQPQISKLKQRLTEYGMVLLYGSAGRQKMFLVRQYAQQYTDLYANKYWLTAHNPHAFLPQLRAYMRRSAVIPPLNSSGNHTLRSSSFSLEQTLVVISGVKSMAELQAYQEWLMALLHANHHVVVLGEAKAVTLQPVLNCFDFSLQDVALQVEPFAPKTARITLKKSLKNLSRDFAQHLESLGFTQHLEFLATKLAEYPLCVEQAAAFVSKESKQASLPRDFQQRMIGYKDQLEAYERVAAELHVPNACVFATAVINVIQLLKSYPIDSPIVQLLQSLAYQDAGALDVNMLAPLKLFEDQNKLMKALQTLRQWRLIYFVHYHDRIIALEPGVHIAIQYGLQTVKALEAAYIATLDLALDNLNYQRESVKSIHSTESIIPTAWALLEAPILPKLTKATQQKLAQMCLS